MNKPCVLYEDNHIIVAVKPQGLPVQADISGDADMLSLIKEYIKEKYNKPGNVYLGLVHRLDRPVGGVMVFAKTSKAAERLSDEFAKKHAKKKYAAVVCGNHAPHDVLECFLRKDEQTYSAYVCSEKDKGAKKAVLSYRRTAEKDGLSLLDISLKTGRHHQIRVQLSNEGMPIYGDHRYNPAFAEESGTDIALYAYSLSFCHPTLRTEMCFTNIPTGGVWKNFSLQLECMAQGVSPAYLDENIIVCDKQKGISVAAADDETDSVEQRLCNVFDFAKPVHRLDATTEGLVMFALNQNTYDILIDAFAEHDKYIHKYYTCTVVGVPQKKKETLSAYLVKDERKARVYVTAKKTGEAKQIITEYELVSTQKMQGYTLSELCVHLVTGRTHQIRAHLAFAGLPILGDDKYGDREANRILHERSPHLRSNCISFSFPDETSLAYLNSETIE